MNAAAHPLLFVGAASASPLSVAWWPLALSDQVPRDKPIGLSCGDTPLALFRDGDGVVHVMEDRCPHRRAPLSLGRITADGKLQCGYHGWTFDGRTGACTAIPNLSANEKVPARYAAQAFRAVEHDGFVWVHAGEVAAAMATPLSAARVHAGNTTVSMEHGRYVSALLDDPQLLLQLPGLLITNYSESDPHIDGELITIERGVVPASRRSNHRFVVDYPWTLRLQVHRLTGLTRLKLRSFDETLVLQAWLAITPASRGTSTACWRAGLQTAAGLPWATRWAALRGKSPLQVHAAIDGVTLSKLPVSGSRLWRHQEAR